LSTPGTSPPRDPVRDGVVAFVPGSRILVVGGADRLRFLHAVTAADVGGLAPGAGAFGALTDDRGRPVSSFHLYVLPEAVLLELPLGRAELAREALERLVIADDVDLAWAAGATVAYESADADRLVATLGSVREGRFVPPAEALVDRVPGAAFAITVEDGEDALALVPARRQAVLRASRLGGHGALHWSRGDRAEELARVAARRDPGVTLALSDTERGPLEIEAGVLGEAELAEARVWNELDAMDAVSLTKGCWMGQEIVRRVHVLGEVQRRRTGVVLDTPHGVGWEGAALEGEDGAPAGVITRAARSRTLGRTVAQAFVRRASWAPGSRLVAVRPDGARTAAITAALPFVRRLERATSVESETP
jgi:folate-binding protein YgfZ